MKAFISFIILCCALTAKAQDNINIEVLNHICGLDGQTPVMLEKAKAMSRYENVGIGAFGKSTYVIIVDGLTSPVKIAQNQSQSFLINTGGTMPEYDLYKVKVNTRQKKRYASTVTGSTFKGIQSGKDAVTINVSKTKSGLYKLSTGEPLEPGEYFFIPKVYESAFFDVFAFRVE